MERPIPSPPRHCERAAGAQRPLVQAAASATLLLAAALCLAGTAPADALTLIRGPCSYPFPAISFKVSTVADLTRRLTFPNTTMVTMLLTANLTLEQTFNFVSTYSCTIFKADPALQGIMPFLIYPNDDQIAIRMTDLINFHLDGIGIWHEYDVITSAGCNWQVQRIPEYSNRWICPGLYMYRCFNVHITQSYIHGRVDVLRSASVDLSYNYIEHNFTNYQPTGFYSLCTVRFMLCGDPLNLIRSLNKLTNNEIVGGASTVINYFGAIGVIIQNNYIRNFTFSGLQCGMGDSNIVDCMLNSFEMNYILAPPVGYHNDGTGIYYGTHWYNPGNRDSCNYVESGMHCYYLDYTSTGVNIEGAVCLRNHDGVKINTGKYNRIESVVVVEPKFQAGLLSCQNWCDNNCGTLARAHATRWWTQFNAQFTTPAWRQSYPHLQTFCTTTQYDGIQCNPSPQVPTPSFTAYCSQFLQTHPNNTSQQLSANATVTGNCSGIPARNFVEIIVVNTFRQTRFPLWPAYYINCQSLPSVTPTNVLRANRFNYSSLGFNDEANDDYGADDPSAPIYQSYPNFYSCPRRVVGIQAAVTAKSRNFNRVKFQLNRSPPPWLRRTYEIFPRITDGSAGGGKVDRARVKKLQY